MSDYDDPLGILRRDRDAEIDARLQYRPGEKLSVAEIDNMKELGEYLDDPPIGNTELKENLPEVKELLDVAWFITEQAIRENTGRCSSTYTRKDEHAPESGPTFTCQCCRFWKSLDTPKTANIRRHLNR